MRVIADVMGADNGTAEIVKGACQARDSLGISLTLVGDKAEIERALADQKLSDKDLTVVDAPLAMKMEDDPTMVLKEKKESSMAQALRLLADGEGDALVSPGNTGAVLVGATLLVGRIKGVRRAALAPVIPTGKGGALLIDSGANTECTPEMLLQFGLMGHFYGAVQFNTARPSIGLLNMGAESEKGPALQKETYALLTRAREAGLLNFVGNVEGRDIPEGAAQVLVADGFTGNIAVKTYEGVALFLLKEIKGLLTSSFKGKLAALMIRKDLSAFKKRFDYKEVGGAPLLGIKKPVVKAHGSSDARSFASAIRQAVQYAEGNVVESLAEAIANVHQMAEKS